MNAKNTEEIRPSFPPPPETLGPPVSPAVAFFAILGLAVAAGLILILQTSDAPSASTPPSPSVVPSPDDAVAPGKTSALRIFRKLRKQEEREYRTVDAGLVPRLYTANSPMRKTVLRELALLRAKKVQDRTEFKTLRVQIEQLEPLQLMLREVVVVKPRFVDTRGTDVTHDDSADREEIRWILRLRDGAWRIHRAVITQSDPVAK